MTTDHIEDVRGMVEPFGYWFDREKRFASMEEGERYFDADERRELLTPLYTHPAEPCARCAELEKAVAFNDETARHYLAGRTDALQKLAALEAENKRLTEQLHALSRTVMSDQVSNDSHSLFIAAIRDLAAINEALELDPDDGGAVPIIDAIDELKATIAQQAEQLAAAEKDAERIDTIERLFFEHQWNGVVGSGSLTHWRIVGSYRHTAAKMEGVTFREAIDAAIAAGKEGKS